MALGYNSVANINGNLVLCRSGLLPYTKNKLDSGSGHGGQGFGTSVNSVIGGYPFTIDYPTYEGSIEIELRPIDIPLIKNALANRGNVLFSQLDISPKKGRIYRYSDIYWQGMTITNAEADFVIVSFDVIAFTKQTITSSTSHGLEGSRDVNIDGLDDYITRNSTIQSTNSNYNAIPSYSAVLTNDLNLDLTSWSITFGQELNVEFTCEGNQNPVQPRFISVGPLMTEMEIEYHGLDNKLFDDIGITTASYSGLNFSNLELLTGTEGIQGLDALNTITHTYFAYNLNIT